MGKGKSLFARREIERVITFSFTMELGRLERDVAGASIFEGNNTFEYFVKKRACL